LGLYSSWSTYLDSQVRSTASGTTYDEDEPATCETQTFSIDSVECMKIYAKYNYWLDLFNKLKKYNKRNGSGTWQGFFVVHIDTETTYDALKTQADTKLNSVVGGLVPAAKVPDTISEIRTVQSASDVTNAVYSVLADSKSNSDAQNYVDRIYRGRNVDNTHTVGVVDGRFKTMIDANIATTR